MKFGLVPTIMWIFFLPFFNLKFIGFESMSQQLRFGFVNDFKAQTNQANT